MNILIRLDISKKIGTGHFRRMVNLSNFMSNYNFTFIIKTDDVGNNIFNEKEILFIQKEEDFFELLSKYEYDAVIIDFLRYQEKYIKEIKEISKKPIITFHEYKDFSKYSDLTINYNLFDDYEILQLNNKSLFGSDYIIFDEKIVNNYMTSKKDYIFVSFGGSDPSGLTHRFIKEIALKNQNKNFKIHIGSFTDNVMIDAKNIEYLIKPENIFKYMSEAKLAITAGGNMMYELIFLQTPSLVIAHNQHQEEFAKNADRLGYVNYVGLAKDFSSIFLNAEMDKMLCKKNVSMHHINNQGKEVIAKAIEEIIL